MTTGLDTTPRHSQQNAGPPLLSPCWVVRGRHGVVSRGRCRTRMARGCCDEALDLRLRSSAALVGEHTGVRLGVAPWCGEMLQEPYPDTIRAHRGLYGAQCRCCRTSRDRTDDPGASSQWGYCSSDVSASRTGLNVLRCPSLGPRRVSAARCSGVPYPMLRSIP